MKFSVIHVSRGRPQAAESVIRQVLSSASGDHEVEYILGYDSDPAYAAAYAAIKHTQLISIAQAAGRNSTEAGNAIAKQAKGDLIIPMSDHTSLPEYWDKLIYNTVRNIVNTPYVLHVDDGDPRPHYWANFPILSRKYYELNGYYMYPAYHHYYADVDLYDVAKMRGMIIIARHIKMGFKHYSSGKVAMDATYRDNESKLGQDQALYQARKKRNFKD